MGERIKELRKAMGLTQQEFAERIGIKRNTVAQYEIGRNEPIETVISLICREFDVSEVWLRTGEGEKFVALSRDDQITDFAAKLLRNEDDTFKRRFVAMLSKLDESDWLVLEKMALELAGENKKD